MIISDSLCASYTRTAYTPSLLFAPSGRPGLHPVQLHTAHPAGDQPLLATPCAPGDEQAQQLTAAHHRVLLFEPGLLAQAACCHNDQLERNLLAARGALL